MVKVTFTLDSETVEAIRRLADRHRKPQSAVVREAVAAYAVHEQKLSDEERRQRLHVLDALMSAPPTRPQPEVRSELAEIRRARRAGWRRPGD